MPTLHRCCRPAFAVVLASAIAVVARPGLADDMPPPSPTVAFDHSTHVHSVGLSCLFCHSNADDGEAAGLPSTQRCMGCHRFASVEGPQLDLLAQHDADGTPLTWVRHWALPPDIRFSHRPHVDADVRCTTCHGPVGEQAQAVVDDAAMAMRTCIDCHRERGAPIDCLVCHQ